MFIVPPNRRRTARLLDDAWAIEYAAAHLHRGGQQAGFNEEYFDTEGRVIDAWEKYAGWYNTERFDLANPTYGDAIRAYRDITSATMNGMEYLDVLGIKELCDDSCAYIPVITK